MAPCRVLAWLPWRFVGRDLAPDVRELATGRGRDRKEDADRITRDAAILVLAYAFGTVCSVTTSSCHSPTSG